jgi:hypothetical protein
MNEWIISYSPQILLIEVIGITLYVSCRRGFINAAIIILRCLSIVMRCIDSKNHADPVKPLNF